MNPEPTEETEEEFYLRGEDCYYWDLFKAILAKSKDAEVQALAQKGLDSLKANAL